MMKRRTINLGKKGKYFSLLLVLSLLLALLSALTIDGSAGPSAEDLSAVSETTLTSLGLGKSTADIEETLNSGEKPTTTNPVNINEVPELAVGTSGTTEVYDLDGANANNSSIYGSTIKKKLINVYSGENVRTVAFDPDGDARKNYIAAVIGRNLSENNNTQLILRVTNSETGEIDSVNIACLPFHLQPTNAGAFLSIAAGDYDGDGRDEIAVVVAGYQGQEVISDTGQGVSIFEYIPGAVYDRLTQKSTRWIGREHGSTLTSLAGGDYRKGAGMYEYFSVNIATIQAAPGGRDSIAVAASYLRGAEKTNQESSKAARGRKYHDAQLAIWSDPMNQDNGSVNTQDLDDFWTYSYGLDVGDGYTYMEQMMFPSVTAGDINSDGTPEVIVAGYRIENAKWSELDKRNLDRTKALITYFSWDAENGQFVRACPMQWIRISGDNSTGLGDRFFNNYSNNDYASTPLAMTVFAERGAQKYNSVFVAGNLLALLAEDETGSESGLYGGYDNPPKSGMISDKVPFRIRYAANFNGYYHYNTAIGEVTSGNLANDMSGREQVIFSFITKHQTIARWDTNLFRIRTGESGTVFLDAKEIGDRTDSPAITVAAPDTDLDSSIFKYNTKKEPAYYFSDPQVIAVLQAAPYFAELETIGDGDPETAMTDTTGSSVGTQHAVEITAEACAGINAEISPGVKIGQIQVMMSGGFSGGWQHETELSQTVGVTYATSYDDSVVLTSTPYIRHYYLEWNPQKQVWEDAFLDTPLMPRTSMISVDMYDEIAKENDWKNIRETALGGSIPGRPETYRSNVPYPESWNLSDFKSKKTDWQSVGSGSGAMSQTMTHERSAGHGATWGMNVSASMEVQLLVIVGGTELGTSYTGGVIFGDYKGVEYEGTVPNIPSSQANSYAFDWQFGTHFVDLFGAGNEDLQVYLNTTDQDKAETYVTKNKLDCMVIGYKVQNVLRPPRVPDDFAVDSTTPRSVTLSWSADGSNVSYYEVARVTGDIYHTIGTINGADLDENEMYWFTDTNCLPGNTYQYAIRTFSNQNPPRASLWSTLVYGVTASENSEMCFTQQPDSVYLRTGQSASFSVGLSLPDSVASVNYQWQQRKADGKWENMFRATQRTLTIDSAKNNMNGLRYRCCVSVMLDGEIFPLYSNAATLNVGKGLTVTEVSLDKESGMASKTETKIEKETVAYNAGVSVAIGENTYSVVSYDHAGSDDNDGLLLLCDGVYYEPGFDLDAAIAQAETTGAESRKYGDPVHVESADAVPVPIVAQQFFYTDKNLTEKFEGYDAGILDYWDSEISDETIKGFGDDLKGVIDGTLYAVPNEEEYPELYRGDKVAKFKGWFEPLLPTETPGGVIIGPPTRPSLPSIVSIYYDWTDGIDLGTPLYMEEVTYTSGETVYAEFPYSITSYAIETNGEKTDTEVTVSGGEAFTVTAAVRENTAENPIAPTGSVRFIVTDKANGDVVQNSNSRIAGGTAVATFTAPYAGDFVIRGEYMGAENLLASYGEAGYTGFDNMDDSVNTLLPNPDSTSIQYGDAITFAPKIFYRPWGGAQVEVPKEEHGEYIYSVIKADGTVANELMDEQLVFRPDEPGKYTITIESTYKIYAYDLNGQVVDSATVPVTGSSTVRVGKRNLTVKAENQESITTAPSFDPAALAFDGLLGEDAAAAEKVFSLQPEFPEGTGVDDLSIGTYRINAGMDTAIDEYDGLIGKYNVTAVPGQLTVAAPQHSVALSAGANGRLTAAIEGSVTLFSGNKVAQDSVVQLSAQPNNGYMVDQWTVTLDGTPVQITDTTTNIQVPVTGDISASVRFVPQRNILTYDVAGSGTLTAKSNSAEGTEIASGGEVTAQTAVFFEAIPDEGQYIKSWTINGQTLMDGNAVFTGGTYRLTGVPANTEVRVEFAPITYYDVTFSGIDAGGLNVGGEVLSEDIERNAEGKVRSGSSFTLTAHPDLDGMYQISEWRLYEADGETYTVLQGNVATYTVTALEQDLDIRVVFETIVPPFAVTFSVDDPEKGSIAATISDVEIISGEDQPAYVPVTFTVALQPNCSVKEWRVNGEPQPGETSNTFTLAKLSENIEVEAVLLLSLPVTLLDLDIGVPNAGAEATVTTLDSEQYTGTVDWLPALTNGRFDWGTGYTAAITLSAKEGWTFAGLGENAFTVNGANSSESPADSGVITAVFPATDSSVPSITSADSQTVMESGTFTVTAVGKPTIQFSLEGAPEGVTIDPLTGVMTIAPGMATDVYTFEIKAENTGGESDTQTFTLTLISSVVADKFVSVGTQTSHITEGSGATVSYKIGTIRIADGTYPVKLGGAPKGVTAENIAISGNRGTLSLNVADEVPPATYPLTVTIDGVSSGSFSLYIAPAGSVPITAITVAGENGVNAITENGGTLQMTASLEPDTATNKTVTWSVENGTGSARISAEGLLTPVANGTVTVKATAGDGSGVYGEREISISGQEAPVLYTVTVDGSHASSSGAGKYMQGDTVTIHAGSRGGYAFDGWTASPSGVTFADAGSASTTFTMPLEDVTVTASWKRTGGGGGGGGGTASYTVTFDPNGGSEMDSVKVARNSTASKPEEPTRVGYEFAGWYADKELTESFDFSTKITKNTTLYAKWTEKPAEPLGPDKPKNPFDDVKEDDWFYNDVMYVYLQELMVGVTNTTFVPEGDTTRAMVAQILYRMENSPAVTADCPFEDVMNSEWYYDAVTWAASAGVVKGVSETAFAPEDSITREQLAAMLYRYADDKGYDISVGGDTNILSYDDAEQIDEWAFPAVQWAAGNGIITGRTQDTIAPQDTATRAEIAAMLYRFIEKVNTNNE